MCRRLAYSGGEIALSELIFNTHHSLIQQSPEAQLGSTPASGDGFGTGWYDWRDRPGLFRITQPAWHDSNLLDPCDHVRSPIFLAHVRASTGSPVQYSNCHPFRHGKWLLVHNGAICGFERIRRRLLAALDDDHFQAVLGSTDSALMFLLAIQFGLEDNPFSQCSEWQASSSV